MDGCECAICNDLIQSTKESKGAYIQCDTCRCFVCTDCSKLSATEIKCFTSLKTRILSFSCQICRKSKVVKLLQNSLGDKDTIIKEKNEIIELLREKLNEYETKDKICLPISYADAAKPNSNGLVQLHNHPNLLIKPKKNQKNEETRSVMNEKIDLAKLKIGVKKMKPIKSGFLIECNSRTDVEKLEKEMKTRLNGEDYEVNLTKMRRPRIKIMNVTGSVSADELQQKIRNQNEIEGSLKITFIKRNSRGSSNIYCECSPIAFNKIMAIKKICIDWERYLVYEDLEAPRCYQCQGFYHKKQNCQNKLVCPICSEEHEQNSCPKRKKCCVNCVVSNDRLKTNHDVNHCAFDTDCPCNIYQQKKLRDSTDYYSEW